MRSTIFFSSGYQFSMSVPPYHLIFVSSYRRETLVWHKSANKQRLTKERTQVNTCTTALLVPYGERDTTGRPHHAEPPLRHVEIYTKSREVDVIARSRDQSHVEVRDRNHVYLCATKGTWLWSRAKVDIFPITNLLVIGRVISGGGGLWIFFIVRLLLTDQNPGF